MTMKELRDLTYSYADDKEILISDTDKMYGEGTSVSGIYELKEMNSLVLVGNAEF